MFAAVTHTCAQTAHKLEYHVRKRAAERNSALDAFGNELLRARLEVSVLASCRHGAQRTHAAVYLETSALEHFYFTGRFFRAREQTAYHDRACAAAQRLDYIAAVLDTAVGDYPLAHLIRLLGAVHDCRRLGHADTRDYTRGADRAGTYTHLDHVRAVFKQRLGAFRRSHVAHDKGKIGEFALDHGNAGKHVFALTVGGVYRHHVHARIYERADPFHDVARHAYRRACEQSARLVFCGMGIFNGFFYVLDGDKTFQIAFFIDEGKFFDAVFAQNFLRLFQRGAYGCGYEVIFGHNVADQLVVVGFEP